MAPTSLAWVLRRCTPAMGPTCHCCLPPCLQGTGRPGPPMYRSARSFVRDASHNRLLAVPAVLYAVNNYLKFGMQLYFKPTTAKMLSNMKVRACCSCP